MSRGAGGRLNGGASYCVCCFAVPPRSDPGRARLNGFFMALAALLRRSRRQWLRPLLIVLLTVGAVLLVADGFFGSVLSPHSDDALVPLSRSSYRHDEVSLSRYCAISRCPSLLGWIQSSASP
jgi:drug/metabolite transporter (DMT)-like permease